MMGSKQIPQQSISQKNQQMVEVCDICGDAGVADLILTCPRCKISREHSYCRKIFSRNYYDDWACDDCLGERSGSYNVNRDRENAVISKLPSFIGRHWGVEKIVTKGKVKCIPTEEVIKLSSGSKGAEGRVSIIKAQVHQKDNSSKSLMTSVAVPGNKETSSAIQGQGRGFSYVPKEMRTVQARRKELVKSIEPVATAAPAKTKDASLVRATSTQRDALSSPAPKLGTGVSSVQPAVGTSLVRKRKETSVPKEAFCAPSLKKPSTSGYRVDGDLPPGIDSSGLMSSEPEAEKLSRVPAKDLTWKGQFNIRHDTLPNMTFQNEARPCSRTSRKVLECSKRMPHLLQFNLIRRGDVWELLFRDGYATINDVGLYFYSSDKDIDRSSSYGFILKFMEGQDLALRCVLSGLELYLFTSKRLPADYQMLDGRRYLWGVFRKIKKHKDVAELYEGLPRTVHQPSSSSAPLQSNIKEPLDCSPGFEETRKLKIQKV